MARELAPRAVTVNSVAPGLIDAPMLRRVARSCRPTRASAQIPLGRLGTLTDVAAAVRFPISPGRVAHHRRHDRRQRRGYRTQ